VPRGPEPWVAGGAERGRVEKDVRNRGGAEENMEPRPRRRNRTRGGRSLEGRTILLIIVRYLPFLILVLFRSHALLGI
jgi:hypothetical protein